MSNTTARIPMLPEQLPLQRIHLVVSLPTSPESLSCTCAFQLELSTEHHPPQMPRSARYLGMVEWAWSPMHNRLDAYYLSTNRHRTHWILWVRGLDGWGAQLSPIEEAGVYAYCLKPGVRSEVAMVYLLKESWMFESREWDLECYHFISQEGRLSARLLEAIAREVWRE